MNLLNRFSFELPTKIEYGVGVAENLADVIYNLNAANVLLITDKGVMRSGLLERITSPLEGHNLKWKVFDRVEANPKDYNVQEGTEIANRFGPDCLVALGGGSPIDCAKAIAVVISLGLTFAFSDFDSIRYLSLITLALLVVWVMAARYAGRKFKEYEQAATTAGTD